MTNQEKFIEKAIAKHFNKYNYSLVIYEKSRKKIKIICKEHGTFEQEPANHLRGQGCPRCSGVKKLTKTEFIEKANKIHNNKYNYNLVDYKNNKTKVKIICTYHGIFETRPDRHLRLSGCPKCANNILYTKEEFIEKSNKIHNNKYNYNKVNYKTALIKVKIICPEHGIFEQRPTNHLRGEGCIKCARNYQYTNDEFIKKANKIHNNTYDYSLTNYNKGGNKIKIICKEHGVFEQKANSHLQGFKCPTCYNEKRTYTTEKFIELAKLKHGNFYDYSLVEYIHSSKKVKIICPMHGEFHQTACSHIRGVGCLDCNSSKGEKEIRLYLENNNINFNTQHIFVNCKNERYLPFDFYLPDINTCIEYDGLQHFKPIEYFGGETTLKRIKLTDKIKTDFCKNNNIELLRIRYNENILNKLQSFLYD